MKPEVEKVDITEKGRGADGETIAIDRRLFVQLLAFGGVKDTAVLIRALEDNHIQGALYADINDPQGVALVTFSEDPDYFVTALRAFYNQPPFSELTPKPEYTMLGRTYSSGYEQDLSHWILDRPRQTVQHAGWDWAVWYPLRRSGAFELLSGREKGEILREHATIGRAYGGADLAHDVRLACHGLDTNDNEFVIGLVGKSLHPLSHVVQTMRGTKQTSTYIAQMGPFFVGRVRARHPLPGDLAPSSED